MALAMFSYQFQVEIEKMAFIKPSQDFDEALLPDLTHYLLLFNILLTATLLFSYVGSQEL